MLPVTKTSSSYGDLVKTFPASILLDVSDDDYQGDTRMLLVGESGQYGYLRFGWGSCSGCDALEAAETIEELTSLRDDMARSAHWEADAYSLAYWLAHRDWPLYETDESGTREFVIRAFEILAERATRPMPALPTGA